MEEVRGIYGGREGEWKGRESNGGRVEVVSRLDRVDQVAPNNSSGVLLFPRQVVPISDRERLWRGGEGRGRGAGGRVSGPGALVASPLLFISVFAS